MDFEKHNITLIRGSVLDENGNSVTTYGLYYRSGNHTYTVRDLSTKRCDVELFIHNLINDNTSLSAIEDIVEDFIS